MIIVDANILIYAYNEDAPQQPVIARYVKELLAGNEIIGLPWLTVWAFVRIATNSRIWANPKSTDEVFAIVRHWLDQPGVVSVEPGSRHPAILESLVSGCAAVGPLVTDAVLAALAIEHGALLASTDRDFHRFPDLRWVNPLAAG